MNNFIFCDKVSVEDPDTGETKVKNQFKPGRLLAGILIMGACGTLGYYLA